MYYQICGWKLLGFQYERVPNMLVWLNAGENMVLEAQGDVIKAVNPFYLILRTQIMDNYFTRFPDALVYHFTGHAQPDVPVADIQTHFNAVLLDKPVFPDEIISGCGFFRQAAFLKVNLETVDRYLLDHGVCLVA